MHIHPKLAVCCSALQKWRPQNSATVNASRGLGTSGLTTEDGKRGLCLGFPKFRQGFDGIGMRDIIPEADMGSNSQHQAESRDSGHLPSSDKELG
jgi:hypothetical protein